MSFTKGISFHHETNAASQPTINNNISINASNELNQSNPSVVIETKEPNHEVAYPPIESPVIERENQFLRKVLDLYMNQQVYWSGKFIVLKADELLELLHILLPNTELKLFTDDIEVNCCGASKDIPYAKINSITFDDEKHNQLNLKYAKSDIVALLNQYRISVKYVREQ